MNIRHQSGPHRFLARLKREHVGIGRCLRRVVRDATLNHYQDIPLLCLLVRVHLAAEFGVFYPALSHALDDPGMLLTADEQFEQAMTIISELESGDQSDNALRLRLFELHEVFHVHLECTEGPSGLHRRAWALSLDWRELERGYLVRQRELGGGLVMLGIASPRKPTSGRGG